MPIPSLRLTLRAVLLFEALTARSFSSLDLNNPEDTDRLLYALLRDSNEVGRRPFEIWRSCLDSDTLRADLYRKFGKELENLGTVTYANVTNDESEAPSTFGIKLGSTPTFTELATQLIIEGGMSPAYVMDVMELWEIPALLEALERRKRDELESRRLFAWITMLPHLSKDSAEGPEKILPFPWEKAEEDADRASAFALIRNATYSPEG